MRVVFKLDIHSYCACPVPVIRFLLLGPWTCGGMSH